MQNYVIVQKTESSEVMNLIIASMARYHRIPVTITEAGSMIHLPLDFVEDYQGWDLECNGMITIQTINDTVTYSCKLTTEGKIKIKMKTIKAKNKIGFAVNLRKKSNPVERLAVYTSNDVDRKSFLDINIVGLDLSDVFVELKGYVLTPYDLSNAFHKMMKYSMILNDESNHKPYLGSNIINNNGIWHYEFKNINDMITFQSNFEVDEIILSLNFSKGHCDCVSSPQFSKSTITIVKDDKNDTIPIHLFEEYYENTKISLSEIREINLVITYDENIAFVIDNKKL